MSEAVQQLVGSLVLIFFVVAWVWDKVRQSNKLEAVETYVLALTTEIRDLTQAHRGWEKNTQVLSERVAQVRVDQRALLDELEYKAAKQKLKQLRRNS